MEEHQGTQITQKTTGVVLAGGRSRRMGADKAALLIEGEPLLRRVVGRLRPALPAVLVVSPPELAPLVPGVRVVPDTRPGMGPLAGLEAALAAIETPRAFVVACDMPFVAPALIRAMADYAAANAPDADAVVLRAGEDVEPLHSVYSKACLPVVTELLDAGTRSLHDLLARLRVAEFPTAEATRLDPSGRSAFNANTPAEWERALERVTDSRSGGGTDGA
ncbi:MAG TPA: molybdenum cofactor guanylyltransferase [Ktedonobacterales bacterium]|nr:molybdenum cofactor guanylyltransferase [Ktedonobacterales bacterium]